MMQRFLTHWLFTVWILFLSVPAAGQMTYETVKQTTHIGLIAGGEFEYQAIMDEFIIPSYDQKAKGAFRSFTYLKSGTNKDRPVTFLFNGGPGSASHWLHVGGFGPKQIELASFKEDELSLIHNKDSLLANSDLVFIDPIGTGYSAVKTGPRRSFWGVVEDAKSVTTFILEWLNIYGRTDSPLFLLGESYGAMRATLVADELQRIHSQPTNGLILLSPVQNYRNIRTPDGSIMGYVSYLPAYAATALHHNKLDIVPENQETFLEQARQFAINTYAPALIAGNRLSDTERHELAVKLSGYTGLSPAFLLKHNLRIPARLFLESLMADTSQKLSRLDSRHHGDADKTPNYYGGDPYAVAIYDPIIAATQSYLNEHIQVPIRFGGYVGNGRRTRGWRWNWNVWGEGNMPSGSRFINVIPNLERTLAANRDMTVFVASGSFDFATPLLSVENALAELKTGTDRIIHNHYKAGHMIYLDKVGREKLSADLKEFVSP